jgi:hypothetical protein
MSSVGDVICLAAAIVWLPIVGFGAHEKLSVSLSASPRVEVTDASTFSFPVFTPFLRGTTKVRSSEQRLPVPLGTAPKSRSSPWRFLKLNGFLLGLSVSLSLGFFTRDAAASWGVQALRRASVTLTHTPTLNVHWPGVVSLSQAGSLSVQSTFAVGQPVFGSVGGTGEIDHSRKQSVPPFPAGTQSLTFETLPPAEHAASAARDATIMVRASNAPASATRVWYLMRSS